MRLHTPLYKYINLSLLKSTNIAKNAILNQSIHSKFNLKISALAGPKRRLFKISIVFLLKFSHLRKWKESLSLDEAPVQRRIQLLKITNILSVLPNLMNNCPKFVNLSPDIYNDINVMILLIVANIITISNTFRDPHQILIIIKNWNEHLAYPRTKMI